MAFLGSGCDQLKPLSMPTDTTKEGPGLFTGETGSFDLTRLCGINQEPQQTQAPCPTPDAE